MATHPPPGGSAGKRWLKTVNPHQLVDLLRAILSIPRRLDIEGFLDNGLRSFGTRDPLIGLNATGRKKPANRATCITGSTIAA
jgi:hypothetical protein